MIVEDELSEVANNVTVDVVGIRNTLRLASILPFVGACTIIVLVLNVTYIRIILILALTGFLAVLAFCLCFANIIFVTIDLVELQKELKNNEFCDFKKLLKALIAFMYASLTVIGVNIPMVFTICFVLEEYDI